MVKQSGYSGTPLAKKLGIVDGCSVVAFNPPENYLELLAPMPLGVQFRNRVSPSVDVIHIFVKNRSAMTKKLTSLRSSIRSNAAIWVSWPKKSSKVETDITEDTIREVCLPMGLVDIKVCAVDEIWSGLKLVIRKELR